MKNEFNIMDANLFVNQIQDNKEINALNDYKYRSDNGVKMKKAKEKKKVKDIKIDKENKMPKASNVSTKGTSKNKSKSNIVSEGYVLLERIKKSKLFIFFAVLTILVVDISSCTLFFYNSSFFEFPNIIWVAVVLILINLTCILFIFVSSGKSKKVFNILDDKVRYINPDNFKISDLFSNLDEKADSKSKTSSKSKEVQKALIQFDENSIDPALYYDDSTLNDLLENLDYALKNEGLLINKMDLARLISNLAESHLIITTSDDVELLKEALVVIQTFFGTMTKGISSIDYLDFQSLINSDHLLFTGISKARQNYENVELLCMSMENPNCFNTQFSPLADFIKSIKVLHTIDLGDNLLKLEKNLWFVIVTDKLIPLEKEITEYASILPINVKHIDREEHVVKKMNQHQFNQLIVETLMDFHMDEIYWKRLDKLVDFINEEGNYEIDNKFQNQIEKFVSVILSLGYKSEEALDFIISERILPGSYSIVKDTLRDKNDGLIPFMENIFGDDSIPYSLSFLKNISSED